MRQPVARPLPVVRRLAGLRHGQPIQVVTAAARLVATVANRTVRMYLEDHCGTYAAAIAYYAIFSLVPLSLVTVSIFGLFLDEAKVTNFIFDQFPLEDTAQVRANVESAVSKARDISAAGIGIGIIALLWSSTGIFAAVRKGLTRAMGGRDPRPFWHGKLVDFALIPASGLLMFTLLFGSSMAQVIVESLSRAGPVPVDTNLAVRAATDGVTAAVSFAGLLLLYKLVPEPRPSWRVAMWSAGFATVLFSIARVVSAIGFQYTPYTRDTALYAGFGSVLALLLWMFITASIVLLGAEFGRAARSTGGSRDRATLGFLKPFR
ncbi:MAG: YihY/virulence factor BrkB family protein [Dehalococcoidia bacterium]